MNVSSLSMGDIFLRTKEQAEQNLDQFFKDNIDFNVPDLSELVGEYPYLTKLGDLALTFIRSLIGLKFTEANFEKIDFSFRAILNEYQKITNVSLRSQISLQNIKNISLNRSDQFLIKSPSKDTFNSELFYLQEQNKGLLSKEASYREELASYQTDNNRLIYENDHLKLRIRELKAEFSQLNTKNCVDYENLNDKLLDKDLQRHIFQTKIENQENIIAQMTEDNKELVNQISQLKDKLTKRKVKIDEFKSQIRAYTLQIEQLQINMKKQTTENEIDNQKDEEIKNYIKTIDILTENTRKLEKELFKMNEFRKNDTFTSMKCLQVIDEFEDRLSMAEEDKFVLNNQISQLSKENNSLKDEISNLQNQITEVNNKLEFLTSKENKESEYSKETNEKENDHNFNENQKEIHNEIYENRIKKLSSTIDTLSSYIIRILTDEDDVIPLLSQSEPLIKDIFLRDEIIGNIESLRVSILENDEENSFFTKIFKSKEDVNSLINEFTNNESNDNEDKSQEYAVLVALCSANNYLIKKNEKTADQIFELNSLLPKEYQRQNMIESLQKFLTDSKNIFELIFKSIQSSKFFRCNSFSFYETVSEFLNEIFTMISLVDEKLRPAIKFRGKYSELPDSILSFIDELNDLMKSRIRESQEEFTSIQFPYSNSNNEELRESLHDMKSEQIELNSIISEKDMQISSLNFQLERTIKNLNYAEKNVEEYKQLSDERFKQIEQARKENEAALESQKETFVSQIKNVIKAERRKTKNEIKKIEQMCHERETILEEKLQKKINKIRELKDSIYVSSKTFEHTFTNQLEDIKDVIHQTAQRNTYLENDFSVKEENYKIQIENLEIKLAAAQAAVEDAIMQNTNSISVTDDLFLEQLGKIISKYKSEPEWNQTTILSTLTIIIEKLNTLNNNTKTASSSTKNGQPTPSQRINAKKEIDEWEDWINEIALKANIQNTSTQEMKTLIKDTFFATKAKSHLLKSIQSLRTQKQLLFEHDSTCFKKQKRQNASMKSVSLYILAAICLSKTSKQFQKNRIPLRRKALV
ncbi:hypothetical protein TRFO_21569 [Tritrichomonas foetus]|uniref:Uncharacterized protein n=1 Tax=Tritrichomonas foetus TaxID=1144522 RepID=A0A1J4KES3_9EUKA|nr:hypothetical protein TRFO_21569 [Tritrichomonas foetus]|eukprot:OHT09522.1 hypothetical protein TRFO_21569 [Tritrichomonas foetus]